MAYTIHQLSLGEWIEIHSQTPQDLEFLKQRFPQFHPTHLEDAMERVVHAKMDLTDTYLFLSDVVPVSLEYGKKAVNFEVSLFLTSNTLVTITPEKTSVFQQEQQKNKGVAGIQLPNTPQLLAYRFLEHLYDTSGQTISSIAASVQKIDDKILTTTSVSMIREIAILQRNIIYFITTLEVSLPFFEELERKDASFGTAPMKEYWGDIIDKLKSQKDALEDYEKLLTALGSAHEMVVNRRTNRIITVLTVFSVIFLPLNLIASIYGMNFDFLPLARDPKGFVYIILGMGAVAGILFLFFKLRHWI